eukprot:14996370-Ditylum_brightwellii.AAC.1
MVTNSIVVATVVGMTKSGMARSTVEILVRASVMYKICMTDPQGGEEEDTWVYAIETLNNDLDALLVLILHQFICQ